MLSWLKRKEAPSQISPEFIKRVSEDVEFTPDMWHLERRPLHNVFVYDGLMKSYRHHHLLEGGAMRIAKGFTKYSNYVMWKKDLSAETFPFVLETDLDKSNEFFFRFRNGGNCSHFLGNPYLISGELYTMTANRIKELDKHMLNTVQFDRKRIKVTIPYRLKSNISERLSVDVGAFMYVGKMDFWADLISNDLCSPVKHYTGRDDLKYYFFNEILESNIE